jgi:adenosylcobinamide-phosphate synthase
MIIESILVVGFAILLDFKFGDPKNKYHPTAWIGTLIAKLTPIAKNEHSLLERLGGVCVIAITSGIVIFLLFALEIGISLITIDYVSLIASVVIGGLLLKTTIAIRGMEKHSRCG